MLHINKKAECQLTFGHNIEYQMGGVVFITIHFIQHRNFIPSYEDMQKSSNNVINPYNPQMIHQYVRFTYPKNPMLFRTSEPLFHK